MADFSERALAADACEGVIGQQIRTGRSLFTTAGQRPQVRRTAQTIAVHNQEPRSQASTV